MHRYSTVAAISIVLATIVLGGFDAQHATGTGQQTITGQFTMPSTILPPIGLSSFFFGAGFNHAQISGTYPWCPLDGNGNAAQIFVYRLWDSGMNWYQNEPTNGTYNWNSMDEQIQKAAQKLPTTPCPGTPMQIIYTFGGIPQWATTCRSSADPSPCFPGPTNVCNGTSCFGGGTQCAPGGAKGPLTNYAGGKNDSGCLLPDDMDSGTCTAAVTTGCGIGANAFFQNYMLTLATRYKAGSTLGTINYYEIRNEPDTENFMCAGSIPSCGSTGIATANSPAQKRMVRIGWDMRQIALCMNPAAKILSPSSHVVSVFSATGKAMFPAFNATSISAPAGSIGSCHWGAQTVFGWQTYDNPNIHPRGTSNLLPEQISTTIWPAIQNEVAYEITQGRPIPGATMWFGDELGWRSGDNLYNTAPGDQDVKAAYVSRQLIAGAFVGFANLDWYQWDTGGASDPTFGLNQQPQGSAYNQIATWMIGSTLQPYAPPVGTLWTETFTPPGGSQQLLMWDSSQSLASCTASSTSCVVNASNNQGVTCGLNCKPQTVPVIYTKWVDLVGSIHTINATTHQVPVGGKPVLVIQ